MKPNPLNRFAQMLYAEEHVLITGVVIIAGLALLPQIGFSTYWMHILILVMLYIALAFGLNIVVGLAGLLDLGYVAFYAVGAYSYSLLSVKYGVPFLLALLVSAALAAAVGVILGWPTIRARGDYLALVTLGFGEIIRLLLRNWNSLTNGPRGIMDVPAPRIAGRSLATQADYFYFALALAAGGSTLFWMVKHSTVGKQLMAIRDDEDSAVAIGINPVQWKLYAFALGAFLAGIGGVFFASWQRFVSPESFTLGESILILSIVVLGGMGRLWPTIVATTILVLLPELLRALQSYRALALGILLVLIVILQEKVRRFRIGRVTGRRPVSRPDGEAGEVELGPNPSRPPLAMPETILDVSRLSKRFGGIRALNEVSLQVRRGEIVGVVGANGAGKSTLFGCIAGAVKPEGGELLLYDDHRPTSLLSLPTYKAARHGVIRTFQQPRLFPSLSAVENVELGAWCRKGPTPWSPFMRFTARDKRPAAVAPALLRFLSAPEPEAAVGDMSFVDQKLTELARALACRPILLMLDEPASGLSLPGRRLLAEALKTINQRTDVAIIVIEHDLHFLSSICDRLIVLDQGQVVASGSSGDPQVSEAIARVYQPKGNLLAAD